LIFDQDLTYFDVQDPVESYSRASDGGVGHHEVRKAAVTDAKIPVIHVDSGQEFEDLWQGRVDEKLRKQQIWCYDI